MSFSELMPNLKLVPMENIRFHEQPEGNRTERLLGRIKSDAFLRNPPIVGDMEDGNFLLLDGANRVSVFKALEYSHIPVQVVEYGDPRVQLKGWHHLLVDGATLDLKSAYQNIDGVNVQKIDNSSISRYLELREVYAIFVDDKTECWALLPNTASDIQNIHHRIRVLDQVVAGYEGQSKLERIKLANFDQLPEVIRSVKHQLCLFPVITKNELLQLARDNCLIPTGLSRHLIPGRALGLNIDLSFLFDLKTEKEKLDYFERHIARIELEGRVRFYEESVFIMNE